MSEPVAPARRPALARPAASPRAWLAWAAAGATLALLAAAAASGALATLAGRAPCALRHEAGIACATCGMTHALAALARGAWAESLALHPWAAPLAAQALAAWLAWGAWLAGALRVRPDRHLPRAVLANAAALAAVWVARLATGTLPR